MPGKDVKDIKDVIEFLIYVMPGFLALRMYRSAYPGRQMSDLIMTAWSLILGIIVSSAVKWIDKTCCHNYLRSTSSDFPDLPLIFALFCGGLLLGGVLVFGHWARFHLAVKFPKFFGRIAPDPLSIWAYVNQPSNRDWAVVYLENDAVYIGGITKYSTVPDAEDQDFLLTDASRVEEDLSVKYKVEGGGVYINTRNVRQIEFISGIEPSPNTAGSVQGNVSSTPTAPQIQAEATSVSVSPLSAQQAPLTPTP